jgi:hypothetical protein
LRRLESRPEAAAPLPRPPSAGTQTRPIIPAGIREFFLPGTAGTYEPRVYGSARLTYTDAKRRIDTTLDVHVLVPFGTAAVALDWDSAADAGIAPEELSTSPLSGDPSYATLPPAAVDPRSYPQWEREFERWVAQSRPLMLFSAPRLKLSSQPGESEREFRIRVQQARHEARDAAVERLRDKYAPKVARLTDRVAKAQESVAKERQQVGQQRMQTAVSIGATLMGALMGRRAVSLSTLGRATTAARGVGRAAKEAEDVARAETRVTELQSELSTLHAALQAEIDAIAADAGEEPIESVAIKAKRGGVNVRLLALAWQPSSR